MDGKIGRKQVRSCEQVEGSEFVEVRSGLKAGERVIVADIGDRKPGDAAFVRGEDAAGRAREAPTRLTARLGETATSVAMSA